MDYDASPPNLRATRTLAAILFTQAVGWTARLSTSEEQALNAIHRDFQAMRNLCRQYEGQILETINNGLLMSFSSAVNAVACAIDIQSTLSESREQNSQNEGLQHQIGVHLGDIFYSDTEVSGNGITIAMQLQAEAVPGAICISQSLYEIVKSSLTFEAQYLGERMLKGIQGNLALYQINPVSGTVASPVAAKAEITPPPQFVSLAQMPTVMGTETAENEPESLSIQACTEVAWRLGWSGSSSRMKKVLLYACRHIWEPDIRKLDALEIAPLLSELLQVVPAFEQLQTLLYRIVGKLNKRSEYLPTVRTILQQIECLYPTCSHNLYTELAHQLEHHEHSDRAKKLILWVCQETWEKDPYKLSQVKLRDLLPELLGMAPDLQQLQSLLNRGVQGLNKPVEYERVAQLILSYVEGFYHQPQSTSRVVSAAAPPSPTSPPEPEVYVPPPQLTEDSVPDVTPDLNGGSAIHPLPEPAPSQNQTVSALKLSTCNVYDLRLNLIKRTNPLRAKVLLFAALHHTLTFSDRSWLVLNQHRLDDLLERLLEVCASPADLETKLSQAAASQKQHEEYAQVAETISKVLRPCYTSS
jgi:adenylate cyclase